MAVFKDVYQQYAKPVYRFLLSLTGSADWAEELLSETFYQAFLHFDRFEGRSSVYTWLCQIGKNAWLKECRRKHKFDIREIGDMEIADRTSSPEAQVIAREERKRILEEIYRLKEPYREVFLLHVFGGVKLKEIAAIHAKTEEWARVTYYRAKSKVAREIQGREHD